MTDYNDGLWHGWNGGECPVHPRSFVEISWRLKDGNITGSGMPDAAECWFWKGNDIGDIIAFRVIKEHKEPREWWVVARDGYAYNDEESAKRYNSLACNGTSQIIHVREVIE